MKKVVLIIIVALAALSASAQKISYKETKDIHKEKYQPSVKEGWDFCEVRCGVEPH